MILSILDNDLYKLTMQHAVVKMFPRSKVRYEFINRGQTTFPVGFADELRKVVKEMTNLQLTAVEKCFIAERCYYLDPTYFDFLSGYRFDDSEVEITQEGGELRVKIEGYWYRAILWEVPILAAISELYFEMTNQKPYLLPQIVQIVQQKAERYNRIGVNVAEFGTRRRFSSEIHNTIVQLLTEHGVPSFIGTSNVYFAMKYNVTPIGTHAHEWFMFHAAKYGFKMATQLALEHWGDIFRGDLGIALSDTLTTDVFFQAFDKKFAKLFDGLRHDSDDPFKFIDKVLCHYNKMRIDPMSKSIIFSDTLTPEKVEKIAEYCRNKIKISFGIGTNFTNDVGVKPLNIVIKMTEAKPENQGWIPTIKLSDTSDKYTGDPKTIQLCKDVLNIK